MFLVLWDSPGLTDSVGHQHNVLSSNTDRRINERSRIEVGEGHGANGISRVHVEKHRHFIAVPCQLSCGRNDEIGFRISGALRGNESRRAEDYGEESIEVFH